MRLYRLRMKTNGAGPFFAKFLRLEQYEDHCRDSLEGLCAMETGIMT